MCEFLLGIKDWMAKHKNQQEQKKKLCLAHSLCENYFDQ